MPVPGSASSLTIVGRMPLRIGNWGFGGGVDLIASLSASSRDKNFCCRSKSSDGDCESASVSCGWVLR